MFSSGREPKKSDRFTLQSFRAVLSALSACVMMNGCTTTTVVVQDAAYVIPLAQALEIEKGGSIVLQKAFADAILKKRTYTSAANEVCEWYTKSQHVHPTFLARVCGDFMLIASEFDAGKRVPKELVPAIKDTISSARNELGLQVKSENRVSIETKDIARIAGAILIAGAVGYVARNGGVSAYYGYQPEASSIRAIGLNTFACDAVTRTPLIQVSGYTRGDGRTVMAYWRTLPDGDPSNNLRCK